jgi:hypothetical protein
MTRMSVLTLFFCAVALVTAATAGDEAYQFHDDFGVASGADCVLQYYYYIPCPSSSWFWPLWGPPGGGMWEPGDVIGKWFQVGDSPTGGFLPCDPTECQSIGVIRFLQTCPYSSSAYPNLWRFDVYCSDEYGCPVSHSLWQSEALEPGYGWNTILIDPPVSVCPCAIDPGPPPTGPRILVTATNVSVSSATDPVYFAADNISQSVESGCDMHDVGCQPALYPRPEAGHYGSIHSGYYGRDVAYCPAVWFRDKGDTTPNASQYGYIELAWQIYLFCYGPTRSQATTWGSIKSIYR